MTITNNFFDRLEGVWQNKLDGEWQDTFGWNLIAQPQLGNSRRKDFNILHDQMRETLTFTKLGGSARNIGVSGEAGFWEGMKYEMAITTPEGEGIHQEMGHFLLSVLENGETEEALVGLVTRQGSIPRANAFLTNGTLTPGSLSDSIAAQDRPFYTGRPETRREKPKRQRILDQAFDEVKDSIIAMEGPDFSRPLEFLQNTLSDNVEGTDWVFAFRDEGRESVMASGQLVDNPVRIGRLFSDFWIGGRNINGQSTDILQYAQVVDLCFAGTKWPHVAINTLVKQQ